MQVSSKVICFSLIGILFSTLLYATSYNWSGTYKWVENAGKRANGLGTIIGYTIKVESQGEGFKAILKEEGFQTDETIVCDTKSDGDSLEFIFSSYSDGKVVNKYGVKNYKKGQRLLTLRRAQIGKREKIFTYWGVLIINTQPVDGKIYFKKL